MRTEVEIIPVKQRKQTARLEILERSIDLDQDTILERWAQTLIHAGTTEDAAHQAHLRATAIMTVVMAAIAQGTFEVSTSGERDTFSRPSKALCVADYLSHASRVMIDLNALSDDNKKQFLKQFPKDELDGRPSSHCTERKGGILTEQKTLGHGLKGTFLNVVDALGETTGMSQFAKKWGVEGSALTDYGVDIQMGGIGQKNLCGGISERGRDGHVLIHFGADSVMVGLEQTKPVSNQDLQDGLRTIGDATTGALKIVTSYIWGGDSPQPTESTSPVRKSASPPLDHNDDETCGLSGEHSMLGHSDNYTSAGSLYFSNLIYKIKLLEDKGELTPAKYNGMRVQLTDGNFRAFVEYFNALSTARQNLDVNAIKRLLKQSPETALRDDLVEEKVQENYLSLVKNITPDDLNACFKQLNDVYGDEGLNDSKTLIERKLNDIQAWLAEPRRLPTDNRVLNVFHDDDIRSTNPHVKRLERTLNHAVMILKQNATAELMQKRAQPSDVIQKMRLLEQAYGRIAPVENAPISTRFKEQQEELNFLYSDITEASTDPEAFADQGTPFHDTAFPFAYLIRLQQLEDEIAVTVSTHESRALIDLMKNEVALHNTNEALRRELQEARAAADATNARMLEMIEMIERMRTEAAEGWATLQAENNALRHPLPPTEAPVETMPAPDDGAANPENPPIQNDDLIWDWAFVWQCISSPAVLNTCGTALMLACLVIAGAAAVGAIPVVLVPTIAVSGLALSAACFFNARPAHPPAADEAAANAGLGV